MSDFNEDFVETDRLKRINYLAEKAKSVGLTEEEKKEREKLRKEFLEEFRKNARSQIERICFVDENGNQTPIKRKK